MNFFKKPLTHFFLTSVIILMFSCEENSSPGHIIVFVHFDAAEAGKKIEILETGEIKHTDSDGIAEFHLSPGQYTVRAYDINQGGPMYAYVDRMVEVSAGKTIHLDVFDCIYCL